MRKVLGDTSVRVTVRLPKSLLDAIQRDHLGVGEGVSDVFRAALRHYIACPQLEPQRVARQAKRAEHDRFIASLRPLSGEGYWNSLLRQRTAPSTDRP